jgi:tetratricopeptide (TPR) repeat protein
VNGADPRMREQADRWRQAVAEEPASAASHHNFGTALWRAGRAAEAEQELRKALELRPHFPEALVNLGGILLARWDYRGSVEVNREAARIRPDLFIAHYNEGLGHLYLGAAEAMVACLRRALELDGRHPGAHYHLAVGLLALGQVTESHAHLDAALEGGFSPAPEFLRALAKAEGGEDSARGKHPPAGKSPH